MANKIALSNLATLLALETGRQKKLCEDFVKSLFQIISSELEKGESIRIKGFGTFKASDDSVSFMPAKELAALVNAPFEMFDTVNVAEELSNENIAAAEEIPAPESPVKRDNKEIPEEEKIIDIEEKEGDEDVLDASRMDWESAEEAEDDDFTSEAYLYNIEENEPDTSNPTPNTSNPIPNTSYLIPHTSYPVPDSSGFKRGFWYGILCMLLIFVIVFSIGYYFEWYSHIPSWRTQRHTAQVHMPVAEPEDMQAGDEGSTPEVTEVATAGENMATEAPDQKIVETQAAKTAQSPKPSQSVQSPKISQSAPVYGAVSSDPDAVYDVVTNTRYLTTIARDHYGNFNLWPIIYEENRAFLGHPDRITPGTRVVVPSLSKYGIDPMNQQQLEEIKNKGIEIYRRFR